MREKQTEKQRESKFIPTSTINDFSSTEVRESSVDINHPQPHF